MYSVHHCFNPKLLAMLDKQQDCDVNFKVEGQIISAHKVVLVAQEVDFFLSQKDKQDIEIENINATVFMQVLR